MRRQKGLSIDGQFRKFKMPCWARWQPHHNAPIAICPVFYLVIMRSRSRQDTPLGLKQAFPCKAELNHLGKATAESKLLLHA
jgi:hypothetical protein